MPNEQRSSPTALWLERWPEISRALDAALELPVDERAAFLETRYGSDAPLKHEVERFLEACDENERLPGLLDEPGTAYFEPIIADLETASAQARSALPRVVASALAGRYRVENVVGEGGMATVFVARDEVSGARVALKVMHVALARQLEQTRFLQEIRITRSLRHPNIIPVLAADVVERDGLLYYVMPYIEGRSLKHRLAHDRRLSPDDCLAIANDVAAALDAAHAMQIIHRDIKPENILLGREGAVVADFGVARAIEEATTQRLTSASTIVGTVAYMSPEQAACERHLDARSDIYALGCVAYEMLAGEPPYVGRSARSVAAMHMHAPIPDIRLLRPEVSAAIATVLRKALAKQPTERFPSAGAFIGALHEAAAEPRNEVSEAARWLDRFRRHR